MSENEKPTIKLRRIEIRNYKGIDSLELDFPEPRMKGDPDVVVLGSENGLGKTSVLECVALLLLATGLEIRRVRIFDRYARVDIPDLLIRGGADSAAIEGWLDIDDKDVLVRVQVTIDRTGIVAIDNDSRQMRERSMPLAGRVRTEDTVRTILGLTPGPVIHADFLMFHSYRKVPEGALELNALNEHSDTHRHPAQDPRKEIAGNNLKFLMLLAVLSDADLIEHENAMEIDSTGTYDALNELLGTYVGGRLGKLRPKPANAVDFLLEPIGLGASFPFDGLSPGQKEIISTLSLVWWHTRNRGRLVLIDEPELHLNAQWHRTIIRKLFEQSPRNQYILATHSEYIMASVAEDRRLFLLGAPEAVQ